MELKEIQLSIQQIVSAISAVLQIEIEVADSSLLRVAGTGLIKKKVWKKMKNEDVVYRHCIEQKKSIIIKSPGFETICSTCIHYRSCEEKGEICSPILINGEVVGVIGLIAFDEKQADRLFSDEQANVKFLERIADVIASKLNEFYFFKKQILMQKKISKIFNYVKHGVMTLDENGNCEYISEIALRMLNLPSYEPVPLSIIRLLKEQVATIKQGKLINITIGQEEKNFFVQYHKLSSQVSDQSAIILLEDPELIQYAANEIKNKNEDLNFIGQHPSIQYLKELILKIVNHNMPVLISGETGTGKSFIAKAIFNSSVIFRKHYERINCAFYTEEELNLKLFGTAGQPSFLYELNEGTIYIEEIEKMPASTQIRLLKALNDSSAFDGEKHVKVQIRFITSTNEDLHKLMMDGAFRQDLYYKLNVIPIRALPLREKKEDILLYVHYFLERQFQVISRKNLHPEVATVLESYNWPGNIQEVANVVAYMCNVEFEENITIRSLPDYLLQQATHSIKQSAVQYDLRTLEQTTISAALEEVKRKGLKKEEAAKLLGISRSTLFRKINDYQIIS